MDRTRRRSLQLSIRSLMITCAIVAILLVPVVWVARERQQMIRIQNEILRAREQALASVVREQQSRQNLAVVSASSASVEELKRENAELRGQLEKLNRELGALKQQAGTAGPSGP
jgi:hypothetical protein